MTIEIVLPWPMRELNPNLRVHWAKKAKAAKSYREAAFYISKATGEKINWDGTIHAFITFYPPDKRHRDDDNLVASFKSARDGIADAFGVNDKRFITHPFVHTETRKGGEVVVRLTSGPIEAEINH